MIRGISKRGISPVISTVLLILLVVTISGIVSIQSYKFMSKAKIDAVVEKSCESIEFVSGQFCSNKLSIENLRTGASEIKTNIEFDIKNNAPNSQIYGFSILVDYDGDVISMPTLAGSEVESLSAKRIMSSFIDDFEKVVNIIVLPRISIDSKMFDCEKREKSIKMEEILEC